MRSRILCLVLCLACSMPAVAVADRLPVPAAASSARAPESGAAGAPALAVERQRGEEHRCRRGPDTVAFGWLLIEYGVATLKYAVGLVLIMLGGILVLMGWLVSAVDWLWC